MPTAPNFKIWLSNFFMLVPYFLSHNLYQLRILLFRKCVANPYADQAEQRLNVTDDMIEDYIDELSERVETTPSIELGSLCNAEM